MNGIDEGRARAEALSKGRRGPLGAGLGAGALGLVGSFGLGLHDLPLYLLTGLGGGLGAALGYAARWRRLGGAVR